MNEVKFTPKKETTVTPLVPERVIEMIANEGFYIGHDPRAPSSGEAPMVSVGGCIYSMIMDYPLDPTRFISQHEIVGPFRAGSKVGKIVKTVPEVLGSRPMFRPGDVALSKKGTHLVITAAEVTVNGTVYHWDQNPPKSNNAWAPGYSARPLFGNPHREKHAWWYAEEWTQVTLGLLHDIEEREDAT